jgi:type II secretory pathway pseudopilin PulG
MRTSERGSTLIIATIVVLIVAVVGVGILRFSSREVAGSASGQRQQALTSCAEAARALLQSRFHMLGTPPTSIDVLDDRLDGPGGRIRALGGHIDSDPTQPVVTIRQVEALAPQATNTQASLAEGSDITNAVRDVGGRAGSQGLGGAPLKVTVHCQEGDLSTPTSGRQLEIEFGVRFGL